MKWTKEGGVLHCDLNYITLIVEFKDGLYVPKIRGYMSECGCNTATVLKSCKTEKGAKDNAAKFGKNLDDMFKRMLKSQHSILEREETTTENLDRNFERATEAAIKYQELEKKHLVTPSKYTQKTDLYDV